MVLLSPVTPICVYTRQLFSETFCFISKAAWRDRVFFLATSLEPNECSLVKRISWLFMHKVHGLQTMQISAHSLQKKNKKIFLFFFFLMFQRNENRCWRHLHGGSNLTFVGNEQEHRSKEVHEDDLLLSQTRKSGSMNVWRLLGFCFLVRTKLGLHRRQERESTHSVLVSLRAHTTIPAPYHVTLWCLLVCLSVGHPPRPPPRNMVSGQLQQFWAAFVFWLFFSPQIHPPRQFFLVHFWHFWMCHMCHSTFQILGKISHPRRCHQVNQTNAPAPLLLAGSGGAIRATQCYQAFWLAKTVLVPNTVRGTHESVQRRITIWVFWIWKSIFFSVYNVFRIQHSCRKKTPKQMVPYFWCMAWQFQKDIRLSFVLNEALAKTVENWQLHDTGRTFLSTCCFCEAMCAPLDFL